MIFDATAFLKTIFCVNLEISFIEAIGLRLCYGIGVLLTGLLIQLFGAVLIPLSAKQPKGHLLSFSSSYTHIRLLYFFLLEASMELVNCRTVNDHTFVLWRDGGVECFEGFQITALAVSLCTILLIPFSLPLSIHLFLKKKLSYNQLTLSIYLPFLLPAFYCYNSTLMPQSEDEFTEVTQRIFGSFNYTEEKRAALVAAFGAGQVTMWKFFLVLCNLFMLPVSSDKYCTVAMFLLLCLILHVHLCPYFLARDNVIMGMCLGILVFWSTASIATSRGLEDMNDSTVFIKVASYSPLAILNLTIITGIFQIGRYLIHKHSETLKKTELELTSLASK